jgi:hypothetical protein
VDRQQTQERRGHPRTKHPIEGSWRGASGGAPCRIGDVSLGGCFVFTQAMPIPGESTVVTIERSGAEPLPLPGQVVYVELGMGFSVHFHDLTSDQVASLNGVIEMLGTGQAPA